MNKSEIARKLFIVTHNGKFHADESLAIAILKRLPDYESAEVIRTRDNLIINKADVVVDVGGVYDPKTHRYDHHQPSFQDCFSSLHKTRLSSAGLVYKHFGKQLINLNLMNNNCLSNDSIISVLFKKIYEKFIEPFDGVDNGVERYENPGCEPRYTKPLDIFDMVNDLNPDWTETENNQDEQFSKAVELVGFHLDRTIRYYCNSWLPARSIINTSFSASLSEGREIKDRFLILEKSCPWKEHLVDLETENDIIGHFLCVVYPDSTSGTWRIQAVPIRDGSFESRMPLPNSWRGLRDDELSQVSGITGCIFVHVTGFIGGNKTREGAIQMALKSLQA